MSVPVAVTKGVEEECANATTATKMVPSDGGSGWAVAGGCFLITFLLSGFVNSFSALKVAIFLEFPDTSPSQVAWIPGLLGTLSLVFSPVIGILMSTFGYRPLVCLGGLLCSAGLALSYLAISGSFLIGTVGGLTGVGAITTGIVCTGKYFRTWRLAAMAVDLSGGCFVAMVLPTAIYEMLLTVGLNYTILVLAGCFTLIAVCGLLFVQPESHFRVVPAGGSNIAVIVTPVEAGEPAPRSCAKVVAKKLSLRFLTDGLFPLTEGLLLLTSASIFAMGMGNLHFLHYIPQHAKSLGIENSSAMLLLAYSAAGDLVVRISYGLLASLRNRRQAANSLRERYYVLTYL